MGSFEEQVQQLAANNRELSDEKARFEEELRKMSETCAYLEQDRDRNVEQVQLLEEQIKEMELGGGMYLYLYNDECLSFLCRYYYGESH